MVEVKAMAERQDNRPEPMVWPGLRCAAIGPMARFVLRGDPKVLQPAAELVGTSVPATLRATTNQGRAILWQGPDEFLILAPDEERLALGAELEKALNGVPHALVDVSHRNIGLNIEGDAADTLLATGVMLDLAVSAFPVGMTTRTLFGKADVTLWRRAIDQFHLETWRSFAPYVTGLLQAGARGL